MKKPPGLKVCPNQAPPPVRCGRIRLNPTKYQFGAASFRSNYARYERKAAGTSIGREALEPRAQRSEIRDRSPSHSRSTGARRATCRPRKRAFVEVDPRVRHPPARMPQARANTLRRFTARGRPSSRARAASPGARRSRRCRRETPCSSPAPRRSMRSAARSTGDGMAGGSRGEPQSRTRLDITLVSRK